MGPTMARKTKPFTELGIDKLKITGKRYHRTEGDGLYIIVNAAGTKTWASYYMAPDGKMKWHRIGDFPGCTLARAREENQRIQQAAVESINPKDTGDGLPINPTLEQVYDLFIKKSVDRNGNPLRESTVDGYKQAFEADVIPSLGHRKIRDLRKRDILPMLEKIIERGSANQANQVFRRLKRVMAFALARDITEFNVMAGMEPVGETNRRSRILSDAEIKDFLAWKPRSDQSRRILRLILITGSRPGEVAGMEAGEIEGDWWTIPAERRKNKEPHRVYLTDMAKELLPDLKDKDGNKKSGPIFTISRLAADQCLGRALKSQAKVTDKKKRGGQPSPLHLPKFVAHDLRRTQGTGLKALGFSSEVMHIVQGRAKLGMDAVYNLYDYDEERELTAKAWTLKLQSIINGTKANVLPFVKRRKAS